MSWFNIFCVAIAVIALVVFVLCVIALIWSMPATLNAKIALTAIIVVVVFGALSVAPI